MVFTRILLASACVLPSVMGLTLNTPVTTDEDGTLAVTWTTAAGDPTFALELVGASSTFDVATGVVPTTLSSNVGLGQIPPGTYKLQAVTAAAAPPAAAPPAAAPPAAAPPAAAPPAAPPAAVATSNAAGGPPFDPAGAPHVGNGAGAQFIGGQCLAAADCASGCCAGPSGHLLGPWCRNSGWQDRVWLRLWRPPARPLRPPAAAPPAAAAPPPPPAAAVATSNAAGGPPFDPAGVPNVGNGAGKQFIGGQCLAAATAALAAALVPRGICSGVGAQTQAGKTGCGFVSKRFITRSRLSFLL
ncbi:hypothetical protein C8F04DRAFT_1402655 [Mycena alexandri]|uniref:Uncharacterized protein n=1 Tax=Mycena alexandri TaxID=1745969 RepID=A0AAD6WR01_9AGAR|nr:hypothetical protein C8F04DRAFT_1402655 [Mycena alexandri]